jgi:hypothetical protein
MLALHAMAIKPETLKVILENTGVSTDDFGGNLGHEPHH